MHPELLIISEHVFMGVSPLGPTPSTLYWVGGSGNWDDFAHWSSTSGGPGGAGVPDGTTDIVIDANSGFGSGGIISETGTSTDCHNFTSISGHNYTILYVNSDMLIHGSAVFEAGTTFDADSFAETMFTTDSDTSETITCNGASLYYVGFFEDTGTWTLQDDMFAVYGLDIEIGTFDANNNDITAGSFFFYANTNFVPTIIMGTGTWEATSNDIDTGQPWSVQENNGEVVNFIPGMSTIKLTDSSANTKSFNFSYIGGPALASHTYNKLWLSGSGSGLFQMYGDNTFDTFKIDPNLSIVFYQGTTQTIDTWDASGTAGNLITINSFEDGRFTSDYSATGPEMVVNGTFNTDTANWTVEEYNPGSLTFTSVAGGGNIVADPFGGDIYQNLAWDITKNYIYAFDLTVIDPGNSGFFPMVRQSGGGGGGIAPSAITVSGHYEYLVQANPFLDAVGVFMFISGNFQGVVDNFSLKEATLDPLSQHFLSKDSGVVSADYLDLSNSNATGGATWHAGANSLDTDNNDGWIFGASDPEFSVHENVVITENLNFFFPKLAVSVFDSVTITEHFNFPPLPDLNLPIIFDTVTITESFSKVINSFVRSLLVSDTITVSDVVGTVNIKQSTQMPLSRPQGSLKYAFEDGGSTIPGTGLTIGGGL